MANRYYISANLRSLIIERSCRFKPRSAYDRRFVPIRKPEVVISKLFRQLSLSCESEATILSCTFLISDWKVESCSAEAAWEAGQQLQENLP